MNPEPAALRRILAISSTALAAVLTLLATHPAAAATWSEVGDAGDMIATAQATYASGALTTIQGQLGSPGDVDIYCVKTDVMPRALNIPVIALQCTAQQGPNVWVFDANGIGVATNATCLGGAKTVTTTTLNQYTTYYVAVGYYGLDPYSFPGAIWQPMVAGERTPDGPGAASALGSWAGTPVIQGPNPYQISLSFVIACDAPTPTVPRSWGTLKLRYQ